jgi:VPDSG-CTERM motif
MLTHESEINNRASLPGHHVTTRRSKSMKHKLTIIIMALAGIVVALATQANATSFTYNFQENGSNLDLGATSTFTEGGFSLTASGFLTSGGATDLYAKSLGSGEVGLGTNIDPSNQHEIITSDFVQLTLPTSPPSNFQMVIGGSVTNGESMKVFFNTTAGTLTGATLLGTITSTGQFVTVPGADQTGFIDITAGSGNVLLSSATITSLTVPDGGSAVALLGIALAAVEGLRRALRTK